MSTLRDLYNNEDLVNCITEDLEDFPEDTPVTYEVWALGYDHDDEVTDAEFFLKEFNDPEEAVKYAKSRSWADIVYAVSKEDLDKHFESTDNIKYVMLEVETVLIDEDDCSMNMGSIYSKKFILR